MGRDLTVARGKDVNFTPRIENRRALHKYFISHKLECGMMLLGSEVKSLRAGKAQLAESFARIDGGVLILYGCHIDPYEKAHIGHEPLREKKLLVHKRELVRLGNEMEEKGTTLIPLAIYFKNGIAKLELGVAHGRQQHDKRRAIREREQERDVRKAMSKRM
jgi:SsrA-binding protein